MALTPGLIRARTIFGGPISPNALLQMIGMTAGGTSLSVAYAAPSERICVLTITTRSRRSPPKKLTAPFTMKNYRIGAVACVRLVRFSQVDDQLECVSLQLLDLAENEAIHPIDHRSVRR